MKSGEALSKEEFTAFKGCTLQGVYSYLIPVLSPTVKVFDCLGLFLFVAVRDTSLPEKAIPAREGVWVDELTR